MILKIALFSALTVALPAYAQISTPVSPPQPTEDAAKIEVLEFFSYGCPHCAEFNPLLTAWVAKQSGDVVVKKVPITFGRAEGAQYRHVQLHEPTVSRMHAKLMLDGKSWSLVNLSETNPVVINGLPLAGEGSTVVLREGDRIEMGEVVFRFRTK